jgi:hypothetical protein
MNGIAAGIEQFLNNLNTSAGAFLAALTAVSVVSMALIQTVKDVFPLRRAFQRSRMQHWLSAGARDAKVPDGQAVSPATAELDLISLSVDGDECAFYDLDIDQLCGQFNAALQVVIDYPARHQDLLRIVASEADPADVETLIEASRSPFTRATSDASASDDAAAHYADARTRVTHQMQRAIDGFQIATGFRWKWWMQLASFAVSALLAGVAVGTASTALTLGAEVVTVVVVAILAGFLAPVSRDLMVALQSLRG